MNRPLTPSLSPSEGGEGTRPVRRRPGEGGRAGEGVFMAPIRGWKTVGTPYEPRSRRRESARLFAFQANGLAPTHVGGYGFRGSTRESFQESLRRGENAPNFVRTLRP